MGFPKGGGEQKGAAAGGAGAGGVAVADNHSH